MDVRATIASCLVVALCCLQPAAAEAQPRPVDETRPVEAASDEAFADSEIVDPELSKPLTPLDQFEVQPIAPSTEAEATPAEVSYRTDVVGLDHGDLLNRFRDLSALGGKSGRAANLVQLRARAEDDAELIVRLLRSRGYFDSGVDIAISPPADTGSGAKVTLTVTAGEQYQLGEIVVTGTATEPENLARDALPLSTGDPIVATAVESAEAQVTLALPQHGYPFASIGMRDIEIDGATHRGDYTLPVFAGPKSSFGAVTVTGDPVFDAQHAGVLARFERGDLYDSRQVDDLRRALVATSLFSSVGVEPVATDATAADGTQTVDIVVRGAAAPTRTLSGSAGYGTGEGFRLEAQWTDRNRFPPEGALTLRGVAGTQTQLVSAGFRRSNAGRRDRTIQALAQVAREDVEGYQANTATLSARLSRDSTPLWQKRWTYSLGAEALITDELGYDSTVGDRVRKTYTVAALPMQIGYDRSDSLLNPTRGFRLVARPSPEVSFQSGSTPYLKALVEGSAYYPIGEDLVVASRLRLGALGGADAETLAPSRRFYAGGGGSVRGFGYQELGPKAPDNKAIGGGSLVEGSIEGRYRFGDFGLAAFVDAGQVYSASTPQFSDLRFGVGVGARYYTAFGPIRVDIATPISRRAGESAVSLYISIGQAF